MTKNKLIIAATHSIATAAATMASEAQCGNKNMRFGERMVTLARIEEEL